MTQPDPLDLNEDPIREKPERTPEFKTIADETVFAIGGRKFVCDKEDLENEEPMLMYSYGKDGGRAHIVFPALQKFWDISNWTHNQLFAIGELLPDEEAEDDAQKFPA